VTFTVRSLAAELQVTNSTDGNNPVPLPAAVVASGAASLTIPADTPPGRLTVLDAVSNTSVEIEVTAPEAP
jgi:hypothetical protein